MDGCTDIIQIKGVGEKTARLFYKLGVKNIGELLRNYPRDYEMFSAPLSISDAVPGELCAVRACLVGNMASKKVRNLTVINFVVKDGTGQVFMTYFNMPYVKNILKKGSFYIFRGILQEKNGKLAMEQAKIYKPEEYARLTGVLQPKYPLTAGLTNHMVTKAVKQALAFFDWEGDPLPAWIREEQRLMPY